MIRPVEQHERIHPKELPERVQRAERPADTHGRDFSIAIERAGDQHKRHLQDESAPEEDSYEPSDSSDSKQDETPQQHAQQSSDPPAENGGVDITI